MSSELQFVSVDVLIKNPPPVFLDVADLLLKFANNILKDPTNQKYRKIRVGNPTVERRLLPVDGAIECLFEMGFQEDGEFFTFPVNGSLNNLRTLMGVLERKKREVENSSQSPPKPLVISHTQQSNQTATVASILPTLQSEVDFFKKLQGQMKHVKIYEDPVLKEAALRHIPVQRLKANVASKQISGSVDIRDLLLLELLAWFKKEFFQWVNSPACESCGASTTASGMGHPTQAELLYGAGRVELYVCSSCRRETRFPRYNHPGKLLETRRGRCGEWANCFTLCCRALDYEARYVLDWTDHVWTEVYSPSQKRWLHCDACENTCDKPLVYEVGWRKKLSYVIAFSKDEIVDVTWRYSCNHTDVLSRRHECRESWLVQTLFNVRKALQKDLSESRQNELQVRMVIELCEFLAEKKAGADEATGRESGSKAWRTARGEVGTQSIPKTIIQPTPEEIARGVIHVQYNCAHDFYTRGNTKVIGWQSLVLEAEDMARKEELDWEMVYLARKEGSDRAKISWKVDVSDAGCVLEKIEIGNLSTATYEDGQVVWRWCSGEACALVNPGMLNLMRSLQIDSITLLSADHVPIKIDDIKGNDQLTLTAELRRGKGNIAWQHTQLFRHSLNDNDFFPFDIKFFIKKI
ncbi:hypothetical protein CAPTEDRAFT_133674 [Capitella teleta]|uniref:Peptide-N(4)-(N-acetyl-beta-glucosaminyl)asparagine amidase n=1 Tax=Capitella teleta TaxID=283909 RepID=R7UA52_CAPTE|nr:hypothetical protein CAPTEDRAFT_133674 [Capitella teleta]|eukprot:ELU02854.1 hypothetical protein CAPTEDRAFT_133674 [Capitella teleta]